MKDVAQSKAMAPAWSRRLSLRHYPQCRSTYLPTCLPAVDFRPILSTTIFCIQTTIHPSAVLLIVCDALNSNSELSLTTPQKFQISYVFFLSAVIRSVLAKLLVE